MKRIFRPSLMFLIVILISAFLPIVGRQIKKSSITTIKTAIKKLQLLKSGLKSRNNLKAKNPRKKVNRKFKQKSTNSRSQKNFALKTYLKQLISQSRNSKKQILAKQKQKNAAFPRLQSPNHPFFFNQIYNPNWPGINYKLQLPNSIKGIPFEYMVN